MRLHWSPRSPFVRKVMVVAHEVGVAGRIELVRSRVAMAELNPAVGQLNPLNKLPTLVLDDGRVLYDSPVICDYLDRGGRLHPAGEVRFDALCRQALGDGLLDLLVLWRNERDRPEAHRSPPHLAAFAAKAAQVLDRLERDVPSFAGLPFDIGHVALGCALGYVDFRFADLEWRHGRQSLSAWAAGFEERPSASTTRPQEG